ncbi:MAG: Nif3-like dinuclear metal center hexameric protein [Myxococcaceae bacterium]
MKRDSLVQWLDEALGVRQVEGDDWLQILPVVYETPHWRNFTEPEWAPRGNGLMVRGSAEVDHVVTCVFPSDAILKKLAPRTFVFTEHPIDDAEGDVFAPIPQRTFERLQRDGISIYTAHAPLDHHPELSPSALIAEALGLTQRQVFLPMARGLPGGAAVVGDTTLSVAALTTALRTTLGAEIPVRLVNAAREAAGRVAVVAGGGADPSNLEAALALGATTFITGNAASPCALPFVSAVREKFLAQAKAAQVNVIDGTHYGTEKPAQLAMVKWFAARDVKASFVPGKPERD